MKKKGIDDLIKSVRQAGKIRRKHMRPSRTTTLEMTNIRPQETLRQLCSMFPSFADEWAEQGMPPEDGLVDNVYHEWTHHQVMTLFLDHLSASGVQFTDAQFRQLGAWLNSAVEVEGPLENAVSTCLLEHMHQVRLDRVISKYLSEKAKSRSHA